MMSFDPIKAGGAGEKADYFEGETKASRDDYYASEGDKGHWVGGLADQMGLAGKEIEAGELKRMLEGYDPKSGKALVSNPGDKHKCGNDIAFGAPKSVSLAWALADDHRDRAAIEAAQIKASEAALAYLQQNAFTGRSRKGSEPVHDVLAARYQHYSSREGDPHLHDHYVVANMDADGRALDFDSRHKLAAGAIYRAALAAEMQKLGHQIERDKSSWRIAGMDPAAEKNFSKRRQQILAELQKTGFSGGKAASIAALSTRSPKDVQDREQQLESWRQAAAEIGLNAASIKLLRDLQPREEVPMPTPRELLTELTATASTFTPQQLNAAIAVAAQGKLDAKGIDDYIQQVRRDPELVWLQSDAPKHRERYGAELRFTTREMQALERGLVDGAISRKDETTHICSASAAIAAAAAKAERAGRKNEQGTYGATTEQIDAIRHICEQPGGVTSVKGMAGTGKSYMMGIAARAWEAQGYNVRGAALAGKAADGLQEGSGIKSGTLHKLMFQIGLGTVTLNDRDIIVVDEAGMVGSKQTSALLRLAQEANAKVILVGDYDQLQPIDAGGAFRALCDKLDCAKLTHITRQKSEIDRQVVRDFASGNAGAALKSMDERGLLISAKEREDVAQKLIDKWSEIRDPDKPGESLMLTATRADSKMLNEKAREILREKGELIGDDRTIETTDGDLKVAIGDRIIFKKNDKQVKNGQLATISAVTFDRKGRIEITARMDNGRATTFRPGLDTDAGEYADVRHGSAVTVHAAQGVTVDHAMVMLHQSMSDREWSYVAASRARESTMLFCTDDMKEELAHGMSQSHQQDFSADYQAHPDQPVFQPLAQQLEDALQEDGAAAFDAETARLLAEEAEQKERQDEDEW